MSFVHPLLLWGLMAVSIPVIIHLFNFRRFRKIYFTNVNFIRDLKQQTQKQSRLRHLLVLLLRMLAIACLVIAFAQPYIKKKESPVIQESANAVSIYIDNSFSMEAEGTGGSLLDLAKSRAKEISSAYRSSDLFQLLTNDFSGIQQRMVSQDEFRDMVDQVNVSPTVRKTSEVIDRQYDLLNGQSAKGKVNYLISDFQRSSTDFSGIKPDTLVSTVLLPLQAVQRDNLYIDSCWFVSPVHQLNQSVRLEVRIRNDSGKDFEKIPVKLTVDEKQKALASFDVKAGSYTDVELPFTNYEPGIHYSVLEITDYPVTFDDKFYMVFDVAKKIPVMVINGADENPYLNSLFGKDSAFSYTNVSVKNIDYNSLQEQELIFLSALQSISSGLAKELSDFVRNGGNLFIIPPALMNLENYDEFLKSIGSEHYTQLVNANTRVSDLDLQNPVFNEVFENDQRVKSGSASSMDLPSVFSYYDISRSSASGQIVLMKMMNGASFLTVQPEESGNVYLLAVPLDEKFSNFPRHAIFVPTLYRIALLSASTSPLYYTIGKDQALELKNPHMSTDDVFRISGLDDKFEFIPEQRNLDQRVDLFVHGQIKTAGLYRLTSSSKTIKGLAYNYDRSESVMETYNFSQLKDLLKKNNLSHFDLLKDSNIPLTETIRELNQGIRLWKLFIILALVFLGLEILFLRIWS